MSKTKLEIEIAGYFEKWAYLVVSQGYQFTVQYYKNAHEAGDWIEGNQSGFVVWHKWEYQSAVIAINLEACAKEEERLEWNCIHELVHILMGHCDYESEMMEERACSEITSAILQTRYIDKK